MISPGRPTSIRVKRKDSDLMPLKRTGQKAGYHCSWIRSRPNRLGLIFRDDRGRSEQIEFVIESDLDLVLLDVAVSNEAKPREG
jgi:hypothetical protein